MKKGAYKLQNIYDQLFHITPTTPSMSTKKGYIRQFTGHGHQSDEVPSLGVMVTTSTKLYVSNIILNFRFVKMNLLFHKKREQKSLLMKSSGSSAIS